MQDHWKSIAVAGARQRRSAHEPLTSHPLRTAAALRRHFVHDQPSSARKAMARRLEKETTMKSSHVETAVGGAHVVSRIRQR